VLNVVSDAILQVCSSIFKIEGYSWSIPSDRTNLFDNLRQLTEHTRKRSFYIRDLFRSYASFMPDFTPIPMLIGNINVTSLFSS